jgi:hypothetical protein
VSRVESRSGFERFVRVRSSERLLALANMDRVFWIVNERLTAEAADCVHVFLSHPAGEFNNYSRPVRVLAAGGAEGREMISDFGLGGQPTGASKRHASARKGGVERRGQLQLRRDPRLADGSCYFAADAADGRRSEGNLGLTAGRCVVPRRGWSR